MPLGLVKYAEANGIRVEYWDFAPPLEAVYWSAPGLGIPPIIGLSRGLFSNRAHFRTVLAEELGHHFTSAHDGLPKTFFHYKDRLEVCREEHRALRWAARYLIPADKLREAVTKGIKECWELAEYFEVDEDLVRFRLRLLRAKINNSKKKSSGNEVVMNV